MDDHSTARHQDSAEPSADLAEGSALLADAGAVLPELPGPAIVRHPLILGLCLMLIAFNLRPVFSSLSVVLPELRSETGLSATAGSLLTTLPVLCLGVFAPLSPRLAHRFGMERVLLGVLTLVAIGSALRGAGGTLALYAGSALAGIAIAIGNVLLPALVKRDFPNRIALVTGTYSMALCGGAATAAALTLPIERMFDGSWHAALAAWSLPAALTAVIWLTQLPKASKLPAGKQVRVGSLWRDPLAWQVTFFMGLQSAFAYCIFGWLAPILRLRGIDGITAGLLVSFLIMVQVAACVIVPSLGARAKDQRAINVVLTALTLTGLLGMMFAPIGLAWVFAAMQGFRPGRFVRHSHDNHRAAIAQCRGRLGTVGHGAGRRIRACGLRAIDGRSAA